jgi:hypothetical protein
MFQRDSLAGKLPGAEHRNSRIRNTGLALPDRSNHIILSVKLNILNKWKQFT